MLILYATQTGNAEFYAEELLRSIYSNYEVNIRISSLQSYDYINLPNENVILFLVSTTGDGEMPQQMQKFWNFLLIKDLPTNSLSKLQFSVFGLGDSSYSKFNYAARKLRSRILQLGAKEFVLSTFGDEMHPQGLDTEYTVWMQNIIKAFTHQFKHHQRQIQNVKVEIVDQVVQNPLLTLEYLGRERLSAQNHSKHTYKYNFQCDHQYDCGDILLIQPQNDDQLVQKIIELMEYDKNQILKIIFPHSSTKSSILSNQCLTIYQLLKQFLDLHSPPSRYFIRIMSLFAKQQVHIEKLQEMSSISNEGQEEYYSYVYREKRNVYEVLFDFQPCKIPIEYLIDGLRLIRSREYSISSFCHTNQLSITVALVEYTTGKNRKITGFCSKYLDNLEQNSAVICQLQKGQVKFPKDPTIPLIMIGPGTGVAPFIGVIEQRELEWKNNKQKPEKTILFFGSCYREKEFYYKELFDRNKDNMILITAFSRDQAQKEYVQHTIVKNKELLNKVVSENFNTVRIYICGTSKKMPQQVEQCIKTILGEKSVQELRRNGQFIVECW